MKINRYSFLTEIIAQNQVISLVMSKEDTVDNPEQDLPDFKQIKETENTVTIICLGFQNEYEYSEETGEQILIKEGLTYDVDVVWKSEHLSNWSEFKVEPGTPNHSFWVE